MDAPFTLIANHGSGRKSAERIRALEARLRQRLPSLQVVRAKHHDEVLTAAKAARAAARGTVFVAGGDGTQNAVANILRGSQVAMAALPLGTFNFFARGFEIPEDPLQAVDALCDGDLRDCSVGQVNGQVFLNNASLGLYPAILRERETVYQRWGRSRMAAYWTVLTTVLRPGHGMSLSVTADGQATHLRTPMIFIGSNPYQLRMMGLEGAHLPEAGKLALYYGPERGRFGMLRTALWLAFGKAKRGREFGMLAGANLELSSRHRHISVAIDGERKRFTLPLKISLMEDALRIVVPKSAPPPLSSPGARA